MYKKTADLHHLHERTASHATKGGARGTPWFEQLSDDEKELIEIRRACKQAHAQFHVLKAARTRARALGDKEMVKRCGEAMRAIIKAAKKMERARGIDETKFRW